jgi:uncharacterized protein (TIGR00251 family)
MILTVKVVPRASKPGIAVEPDGSLKVRLQSPPVDGAANEELVEVLADAFDLPRRAVTIVGGAHSRTKRVQLDEIDEQRLATLLRPKA